MDLNCGEDGFFQENHFYHTSSAKLRFGSKCQKIYHIMDLKLRNPSQAYVDVRDEFP